GGEKGVRGKKGCSVDVGLKDKVFVVGGGSKGLGRGVAQALVEEGARVLLLSRDEESLDKAVAALGSAAKAVPADMAYPGTAEQVAAVIAAEFGGRLDGILINAGGPPAGKALELSEEQWLDSYQLLIGGPLRLLKALVPKMDQGGAILFITSTSVRQPIPNLDTSNVLRPGVAALAKTLARELAPDIRVNSLAPGRFNTDRIRALDAIRAEATGVSPQEIAAESSKQIPIGRYGEPIEFGRFAAFLLSPAASYISGLAAHADGALVTALP
ncbi:MAG: SDR family oxidoreductase, partial [Thermomicrobiales bacterium]